ncbi:MAG TPA: PaaI family thioesterase [Burkholderiaceae bacterium]|nr:PaaI family thioesterase [Burkholderiaceae bacterium]
MPDTPTPDAPAFEPADPSYRTRVRDSFARQRFMALMGASMVRVEPGVVVIDLPFDAALTQQHGFVHGGAVSAVLDTPRGYAASSLMPADAGVLTVEFKVNYLAAAVGERFRFTGRVRRAGRTVTFVEADAVAVADGRARTVATMQATMMTIRGRDDVRH